MSLLARAGDIIRDEDGAIVATVARDLYVGEPLGCSDVTFADGRRRAVGELMPRALSNWVMAKGLRR